VCIKELVVDKDRLYYEYNNSGDGAGTSGRKYLSASSTAITKAQIWPVSGTDWYDKSY
jgi:pectinesterase